MKYLLNHFDLLNPAIGFSAALKYDSYLCNDQATKYENVITNLGNGYNNGPDTCQHLEEDGMSSYAL